MSFGFNPLPGLTTSINIILEQKVRKSNEWRSHVDKLEVVEVLQKTELNRQGDVRQNKLIIKEKFAASRPWRKEGSDKSHIKKRQWPRLWENWSRTTNKNGHVNEKAQDEARCKAK